MPTQSRSAFFQCCERGPRTPSGHTTWFAGTVMLTSRLAVALFLLLASGTVGARLALEPVDTSSPRATMQSFLMLGEEQERRLLAYRYAPTRGGYDAILRLTGEFRDLLDLSQVPQAARREVAIETFFLLWEILARVELPSLEEIPDGSVDIGTDEKTDRLLRWPIPGTGITIARVDEGPQAGQYLFSARTVRKAPIFYEEAVALPYLRVMTLNDPLREAQLFTGRMIPSSWVEALPDWANAPILRQVVWKWLALLLLLGLTLGLTISVIVWSKRRPGGGSAWLILRRLTVPLAIIVLAHLAQYLTRYQINVTGAAAGLPDYLFEIGGGLALAWCVWLLLDWTAEAVIASPRIDPRGLNAGIVRLVARSVGILLVLVLLFRLAGAIGIPVYGLVAGAGVGGIAIAMAAKSTLENFLGALNLFVDRPVKVGDLCRFDDESSPGWRPVGKVEAIGLRSTKVRRLDRSLITIPNSEFAQRSIVNLSACERFLIDTTLGLRYETTDDQLRYVLAELRELLHSHPKTIHTSDDPIRARLVGFADYSLAIAVRAYIRTSDYSEFLAIQEDILLRMMKIVEKGGTGFAFPSRTLYVTRDGGLDEERQRGAEKQVREWASAHALPFPDFTDEHREQITGTLDYPPEGSPDTDSS